MKCPNVVIVGGSARDYMKYLGVEIAPVRYIGRRILSDVGGLSPLESEKIKRFLRTLQKSPLCYALIKQTTVWRLLPLLSFIQENAGGWYDQKFVENLL